MRQSDTISRRAFLASVARGGRGRRFSVPRMRAGPPEPGRRLVPGRSSRGRSPRRGEKLPLVGLGSWITFNVGDDAAARDSCAEVMRAFFQEGGRLIDSSPMYGSSQEVIGYGLQKLGQPVAALLGRQGLDLLGRARPGADRGVAEALGRRALRPARRCTTSCPGRSICPTLFAMKKAGRLRYVGVTTSDGRRHDEIEKIMRSQPIDFVQVTYNVLDREVEERILPLARERQHRRDLQPAASAAVTLIQRVERAPLPAWAGGDRLRELGAGAAEVHRVAPGRHLRDPGDEPRGPRAARTSARPTAGCRTRRCAGASSPHVEKL